LAVSNLEKKHGQTGNINEHHLNYTWKLTTSEIANQQIVGAWWCTLQL
jgi:hypothetical protein